MTASVRVCANYFRQMSAFTHEAVMHPAVVVVTTYARVRIKAQTKLVGPFLLKFVERDLQALALSFASNCH